jgi:hypothetical protein
MSTPKTAAQLRAENKQLAEELAEAKAQAERAERLMLHADGFTFRLPNPRALIRVQANGYAHWAVFLTEPTRSAAWDGDDWGPTNAAYDDLYRWTQAEALAAAESKAGEAWEDHERWSAGRQGAPTRDEFLAEFGPAEVA